MSQLVNKMMQMSWQAKKTQVRL